jgi:hypothetical protein
MPIKVIFSENLDQAIIQNTEKLNSLFKIKWMNGWMDKYLKGPISA